MGSIKRWLGYLVLLLVLVLGVLFSIQNTAKAPLDILIMQLPEQRVALWILLAFAAGGAIGLLISSVALVRLKSRCMLLQRRLDRQHRDLEESPTSRSRQPLPKVPTADKKGN